MVIKASAVYDFCWTFIWILNAPLFPRPHHQVSGKPSPLGAGFGIRPNLFQ